MADDETLYWDTNEETLEQLRNEFNISSLPKEASPSLWNQVGLKPIILLLIGYIIYALIKERREKKEEEQNRSKLENDNEA